MKKNLLSLIILLLIFPIVEGCKKDSEEENPTPPQDEIILQEKVKYLDESAWNQSFVSIDSTDGSYYFNTNINSFNMGVGDVLVSSKGEGILRMVENISQSGDQIKVSTSQATLEDLFVQADIEFEQTLSVSNIKSIEYSGEELIFNSDHKSTNFDWDIESILYDDDSNPQTTYDQIRVEGNFSFDWNFIFKLKISPTLGLKEVNVGFESEENLNLELIAGLAYTQQYEKTLATIHFSPITIPAGPIVIIIIPSLPIKAGVSGYANASITTSIEQGLSFDAGVHYIKADGWTPYAEFNNNFSYQPPQLNLNAGAEAYIKPEFITKIYGVVGPYANIKLYGKIDADLFATPWWTLSAGAKMDAGVKATIFSKVLFDVTFEDLFSYEKILAQASTAGDPPIAGFTANITGGQAPLTVTFTDQSTNDPTTWLWDFGDGTTSTDQHPTHIFAEEGNYSVSLTVTNDYGSDAELKIGYINVSTVSLGDFGITSGDYEYDSDWDAAVLAEFGSAYRVADWSDLVSFYNSGGDLLELFDELGLTEYGNNASLYRNGGQYYSSSRSYFATRHEHNKPPSYLAHENIDNYLISLGSWTGLRKIMVKRK